VCLAVTHQKIKTGASDLGSIWMCIAVITKMSVWVEGWVTGFLTHRLIG
jgi:hypothetical protein